MVALKLIGLRQSEYRLDLKAVSIYNDKLLGGPNPDDHTVCIFYKCAIADERATLPIIRIIDTDDHWRIFIHNFGKLITVESEFAQVKCEQPLSKLLLHSCLDMFLADIILAGRVKHAGHVVCVDLLRNAELNTDFCVNFRVD